MPAVFQSSKATATHIINPSVRYSVGRRVPWILAVFTFLNVFGLANSACQAPQSAVRRDARALDVLSSALRAMTLSDISHVSFHSEGVLRTIGKGAATSGDDKALDFYVEPESNGGHRTRYVIQSENRSLEARSSSATPQFVAVATPGSQRSGRNDLKTAASLRKLAFIPAVEISDALTLKETSAFYMGTLTRNDKTLDVVETKTKSTNGAETISWWYLDRETHLPAKSEICIQTASPIPCGVRRAGAYLEYKQFNTIFSPGKITVIDNDVASEEILLSNLSATGAEGGAK